MVAANEFKGHEATVATNSLGGTTLGKIRGFTFEINNNMVGSYVAGSRNVDNIKEGNLVLTGSVTMSFRDKTEIIDIVVTDPQVDDDLFVRLDDDISSNETVDLTINDLKWDTWSTEFDNSGETIEETATFMAKTLVVAETTN